jgi:hypothetical protein
MLHLELDQSCDPRHILRLAFQVFDLYIKDHMTLDILVAYRNLLVLAKILKLYINKFDLKIY